MIIKKQKIIIALACSVLFVLFGYVYWSGQSTSERKREPVNTSVPMESQEETPNIEEGYIKPKRFSLHYRSELNSQKMITTIRWNEIEHASKYVITSYMRKKGEWEKIEEETITAGEETIYQHKFSYGKTYKYEMAVYQNVAGDDLYLLDPGSEDTTFFLTSRAPKIFWSDSYMYMNKKKKKQEFVKLAFCYEDDCLAPVGCEIYRGESKDQMVLLDTIDAKDKKSGVQIYKDKTVQEGKNYFYKIKSFILVDGEKRYGKKSDIKELSSDDSWGICQTRFIISPKNKVDYFQVVLTSQDNQTVYFGKNYKNKIIYYGQHKRKTAVVFFCDGDIVGTDVDLGLDEISYKYKKSQQYMTLSDEDIISIKPGEKLYLRFARKDHKKFANPVQLHQSNTVSIYLFSYKGHLSFLDITSFDESLNYVKWRKEDDRTYWY